MIQEHGNLHVCLVTSFVICPVKYRVVISLYSFNALVRILLSV